MSNRAEEIKSTESDELDMEAVFSIFWKRKIIILVTVPLFFILFLSLMNSKPLQF